MEPKNSLQVGLVQFKAEVGNISRNIEKMAEIIEAHRGGVDLLIFPEYSVTGYSRGRDNFDYALKNNDKLFKTLIEHTRDTAVVFGYIEETKSFQFYNSLAYVRDGELVDVHRKIYLANYGVFEERKYFTSGTHFRCWNIEGFRVAPFICADAWNPALVHLAAAHQAHMLIVSACSPEEGLGGPLSTKESWKRMNRFYSGMYGVYTAFTNRVGNDGGLKLWGESEIIDPFGRQVVGSQKNEQDFIVAKLELNQVRRARTMLHTIRDDNFDFLHKRMREVAANKLFEMR